MNARLRSFVEKFGILVSVFCVALFFAVAAASAQEKKDQVEEKPPFNFQAGPMKAHLGAEAEINVPKAYSFLDASESQKFMSALGNIPTGRELGTITPESQEWLVVFEFSGIGYVKDDEKDSLDADAILESIRAGTEEGNKARQQRGMPTMHVTGWKYPPSYDPSTNNLQWCVAAESEGQPVLNYNTRILGRHGVMEATLVCGPNDLDAVVQKYKSLIAGYSYTPGNKYGEFRSGDKVAEYGLAALVAGGGLAAAAKTGLLGKLGALIAKGGKLIIVAVIGVLVAVKSFFGRLFGSGKRTA